MVYNIKQLGLHNGTRYHQIIPFLHYISWKAPGYYQDDIKELCLQILHERLSTFNQLLLVSWQLERREEISLILLISQNFSVLVLSSIFRLAYFIFTASVGGNCLEQDRLITQLMQYIKGREVHNFSSSTLSLQK